MMIMCGDSLNKQKVRSEQIWKGCLSGSGPKVSMETWNCHTLVKGQLVEGLD